MAEKDFVVKKGLVVSEGITLGGHAFDDIDIGTEFTDADDHIMSSGAIKEKIEAYNYLASVDISANTNLAVSSPITLSGDTVGLDDPANLSELNESTDATDDKVLLWDESASAWKYMTLDNLQDAIDTTGSGGIASLAADDTPQLGGDLDVDGNDIVSTSNGPIDINPNGTGKVRINTTSTDGVKLDVRSDNNATVANFRVQTSSTNAAQTAIQLIAGTSGTAAAGLGAKLQFRQGDDGYAGYTAGSIYSSRVDNSNHHLHIVPEGTGNVSLGNFTFNADQSVGSGQDNYVLTYDHSAETIGLEEASGGGGASAIGSLDDVTMDATNFADSLLIQPDSDGSAPSTGTLSSASDNIGIGRDVFNALTSGSENYVIGSLAGYAITSGSKNVLMGKQAGEDLTTEQQNVLMGYRAGQNATSDYNIAIGGQALQGSASTALTGDHNVAIGYNTLASVEGAAVGNIAIGRNSLKDNTTADYNIAIGYDAADSMTTGGYNVLIGREAGQKLTTTTNTVAIGDNAGRFNTGGSNTFVGTNAGKRGSEGATSNNTIIGLDAGGNNTGGNNTIIGHQALTFGAGGADNVVIGYWAGQDITSDDNVAIGASAALNVTSGTRNIAIGAYSMDAATTDSDNIAIGYDALGGAVSGGEKNIAIGSYAGDAITSADKSVLIGYDAGTATTTAFATVGIGHEALKTNEYGSQNVAVGNEALESINNHFNVAVGSQAFQTSTSGIGNTVVGHTAGKNCGANASYNAFFGYRAGDGMDGNYNTAVGTDAMKAGASASGADNTAIGMAALEILTTGSTNIALGHDAGNNITTGSNNVVIGAADVTADADDQLKISSGDGSPVWIEGNSAGVVLGALTPMFFERAAMDTSAVDFRVPTVQSSAANPNSYPMPYAGTVLAASFIFVGSAITTSGNSNTIRIRKNGGTSGGDIQEFTFDEGDLTNTHSTTYTLVKTGLTFTFSAGEVLQVRRQSGSTDLNNAQCILWVKYNL